MKRSGPPRRRRALARGGPIKAKPRSKAEFARVYGGADRARWTSEQRCCFCGRWPTEDAPTQAMHITTGGMGRKDDASRTLPACHRCHDEAHHGIESFCRRRGLTREALRAMAADYDNRWSQRAATPARTP